MINLFTFNVWPKVFVIWLSDGIYEPKDIWSVPLSTCLLGNFLSDLYWDQSEGEPDAHALLNICCLRLERCFMFVVIQGWWNLVEENLDGIILSIHSIQAFLNIFHKWSIGVFIEWFRKCSLKWAKNIWISTQSTLFHR